MDLKRLKVYIIGGNAMIANMFESHNAKLVDNLDAAAIAVWTGGQDVSPDFYGEEKHPKSYCHRPRDVYEEACFKRSHDKIKVGICRGAQFLNVMNGGKLWQDVDNHALSGTHPAMYKRANGLVRAYNVTSTHHQQMIPNLKGGGQVWSWAGLTTRKVTGNKDADGKFITFCYTPGPKHNYDAEVVFYDKTKSLCFQPHPEYQYRGGETENLFFTCLERVLAA